MGSTTIRRTATIATTLASLALAPHSDASATQVVCGYHHVNPDQNEGAVAVYTHCADSFILILIHIDNSNGHAYHRCVSPWSTVPFFRGDGVTFGASAGPGTTPCPNPTQPPARGGH
ncbi:DUF6355 family natural product biosynthesis protein [Saccharothrix variisporea]|uniref:Secreted protein n=1 Tax=Saccharothrix variisporea TaxID=543527 RepID=A0A495X5Z2_9PSEU|nr:hypothetical protein DFJ66_2623 [Saccharothrix variisporea]